MYKVYNLCVEERGGGGGGVLVFFFFFSSRRRHTRSGRVTGVQSVSSDLISRDALGIAHDLQQRIDELRAQAQRSLDAQDKIGRASGRGRV